MYLCSGKEKMGNQKKIRIALAEDHQVLRQGMVTMLSNDEKFSLRFRRNRNNSQPPYQTIIQALKPNTTH